MANSNSQEFKALFICWNEKQFWITYLAVVTNVNWWCCSHINWIKGLMFELLALHDYGVLVLLNMLYISTFSNVILNKSNCFRTVELHIVQLIVILSHLDELTDLIFCFFNLFYYWSSWTEYFFVVIYIYIYIYIYICYHLIVF